jgi:hypothetical protein
MTAWANRMWPQLRAELEQWCAQSGAQLVIDDTAGVFFWRLSGRRIRTSAKF